jgi:hypothetical protein
LVEEKKTKSINRKEHKEGAKNTKVTLTDIYISLKFPLLFKGGVAWPEFMKVKNSNSRPGWLVSKRNKNYGW